MSELSFARIMYGTSEGIRSSAGFSSSGTLSRPANSFGAGSDPGGRSNGLHALENLLHKAWLAVSTKH